MNTALLALVIAQTARSVTPAECAKRVTAMLPGLGVKGPLYAYGVTESRITGTKNRWWNVWVGDRRRRTYEATFDLSGRLTSLVKARAYHGPSSLRALNDARYERLARRWMTSVHGDPQVRLEPILDGDNNEGFARFTITRHDHPFVAQPRFGYEFTFTVPQGEFLALRLRENPPPVEMSVPRISQAQAAAAVKPPPENSGSRIYKRVIRHQVARAPELAWYQPPGKDHAVLVWRIVFENYREPEHIHRSSDSQVLIDSNTGERIPMSVEAAP